MSEIKINPSTGSGLNYSKFTPAKVLYEIRKKEEQKDTEFLNLLRTAINEIRN